jgi:hypothetical protein
MLVSSVVREVTSLDFRVIFIRVIFIGNLLWTLISKVASKPNIRSVESTGEPAGVNEFRLCFVSA